MNILHIVATQLTLNLTSDSEAYDWSNETFREMQRGFSSESPLIDYANSVPNDSDTSPQLINVEFLLVAKTEGEARQWVATTLSNLHSHNSTENWLLSYQIKGVAEFQVDLDKYEEGDAFQANILSI